MLTQVCLECRPVLWQTTVVKEPLKLETVRFPSAFTVGLPKKAEGKAGNRKGPQTALGPTINLALGIPKEQKLLLQLVQEPHKAPCLVK